MDNTLLQTKGRIFNIQRFSIHDGPGIRTIVFLKGCPMRCRWCCNPESQEWECQKMLQGGKETVVGKDVTVEQVLEEAEKDRVYYMRSGGGGITLSGGECTWQPDFSCALLQAAKERGIGTAIETTGYAKRQVIEKIIAHTDTVLMDIKHMDSEKHKEFTTAGNELILENARYIAENAKELIIRTPVVPTFNDTDKEIEAIAQFAASLKNVKEMHILPYHKIGSDKYTGLGRKYMMSHINSPSKDKMRELAAIVEKTGLKCQIGG